MTKSVRDQNGTTLLEVLFTVLIMAIGFSALIGGLWTSVVASDQNVQLATAEATGRAYAEFLKREAYADCANETTYGAGFEPVDGFPASVTTVRYWNRSASPPAFESSCPSNPDHGLQLILVRVESERANEQLEVVKRR